jgi:hypothetical protein
MDRGLIVIHDGNGYLRFTSKQRRRYRKKWTREVNYYLGKKGLSKL